MKARVIGIDEAGRGPLAGPLAVCGMCLLEDTSLFADKEIRDSKKLSEKRREEIFLQIQTEAKLGKLKYAVSFVSPYTIDTIGMSRSLSLAVEEVLKKLNIDRTDRILLDGSLKAPETYLNQDTIIKGDESEPPIALASIVAKVTRDKKMKELSVEFPEYGFEKHKGYGTKDHIEALRQHGTSPVHRVSFCRKVLT